MKQLEKDLQSILKNLTALTKTTEKMTRRLEKLERSQAAKRSRTRKKVRPASATKGAAGDALKGSAMDRVLTIINKSRKGVGTAGIKERTGFTEKKIWGLVNRAKRQGKVRSLRRGLYIKA